MPTTDQLRALEARLLCALALPFTDDHASPSSQLGPPYPSTPKERGQWMNSGGDKPPPLVKRWEPPAFVERYNHAEESGFMLNDRTVCFQRGRSLADTVMGRMLIALFSNGFKHPQKATAHSLLNISYDYAIVILGQDGTKPAAACLVEVRCDNRHNKPPYLYVFELTTAPEYGHHGLAHQLVHSVDALAHLIKSDTREDNPWHTTLRNRRLFIALTVDQQQDRQTVNGLVRLYGRTGLQRYDASPSTRREVIFDHQSFTPGTECGTWNLDSLSRNYITMYKEAKNGALYNDGSVTIYEDTPAIRDRMERKRPPLRYYHHRFPERKARCVASGGIVNPAHRLLYQAQPKEIDEEKIYIPAEADNIIFNEGDQRNDPHCFNVLAQCTDDHFTLSVSVPAWYAAKPPRRERT